MSLNLETKSRKVHKADIEKWNAISKHTGENEEGKTQNTKIRRTIHGKPICMLCRRKFETVENLRQHETVSALHKHILAKRKKVTSKSKENDYRDRATERRKMYEPDPDTKCSVVHPVDITLVTDGPSLTKARTVNSTEAVIPNQMLNETNIGNKMLQKLGWKGGSLGTGKMDGNNNQLKQDWERIETLVAATKGKL